MRRNKRKVFKYLVSLLVLFIVGTAVYINFFEKKEVEIVDISWKSDDKACYVSFTAKNLTSDYLLAIVSITFFTTSESRMGASSSIRGHKEIEVSLSSFASEKITTKVSVTSTTTLSLDIRVKKIMKAEEGLQLGQFRTIPGIHT